MGILVALLRIIALVLIAGALMALGYDAFSWSKDHAHQLTSLQGFAVLGGKETFFAAWPGFVQPLLAFPAFLVLGVIGIVLALISKFASRG